MRKLSLDLSALRVESFEPDPARERTRGTVRANEGTVDCSEVETCGQVTYCFDTCFCPNTSPQPSCDECSWQECTYLLECP